MNLLLLNAEEIDADGTVLLRGRRLQHLVSVRDIGVDTRIATGILNGPVGEAIVQHVSADEAVLRFLPSGPPPPPLPATLIIALPRPKMIKRILQTAATMGVKQVHFINSYKVEKSYWSSPWLSPEKCAENLLLGLEQGMDTVMPEVFLHPRFKPFVEDTFPGIVTGKLALLAHPGANTPCPVQINQPAVLVIGPEGGFIPYEVDKLVAAGCQPVSLGPRILRVETAVPVLLGRLFDLDAGAISPSLPA